MSALQIMRALVQLCFLTLCYRLAGMANDTYYVAKARAWCDLRAYPQAIRCLQKALRETEMAFIRAQMAWCYMELGMMEQAVVHYRAAYERSKHPYVALGLAWAEWHSGHAVESRALVEELRRSRFPLVADDTVWLNKLEEHLDAAPH